MQTYSRNVKLMLTDTNNKNSNATNCVKQATLIKEMCELCKPFYSQNRIL